MTPPPTPRPKPQRAASANDDANYFYAGYGQQYGGKYQGGEDAPGSPTRGARAVLTVHAPFVEKQDDVHSLAEISVTRDKRVNFDQVEVGWRISRIASDAVPASSTKPRLFVFHWIGGDDKGYNSPACKPFGRPSQRTRKGAALTPTSIPRGRTFAIVHDDAQNRWEITYRGRPVCALADSLWGGDSPRFTRAQGVQSYGEVTDPDATPCSSMGNGRRPRDGGAASFRDVTNIGGEPATDDLIRNGGAARDNGSYQEEHISDDTFLYGGPGGC